MNLSSKIALAPVSVAALGLLAAPFPAIADDVPDALSVFEDAEVRVARCTFPPGATHVCHSNPSYMFYALSGGKEEVQDEKGTRTVDIATGTFGDSPPVPWHEVTNVGETTLQFLGRVFS